MMRRNSFGMGRIGLFLALMLVTSGAQASDRKPLWLAIARPELAEPLKPLAEKRRGEGFEAVVLTKATPDSLMAAHGRPDFLLLVGDDEPGQEAASWYLPTKHRSLYRWRSVQPPEFASDAAWGDLDGDGQPEIPVGRIPARSREQVATVVQKTLAFEAQTPTAADLQAAVWLGSPEYTPTINAMASGLGIAIFQTKGPAWLRPWFVSGNPSDPFCGWPPEQSAAFTRQMKQGGVLGVLMGHASAEAFYSMAFNGKPILFTAADAAAEFGKGPPVPPMVFFSCHSGKFNQASPCLAKSLLLMPGGPVATIGATTESHPLPNYFSGVCLLTALSGKENRLGTVWFRAQREARQARDFVIEMMLRDAEGSLEKPINVEKLRRDQVLMYALLGDPATRLRLPEPLEASVERTATGWRWRVSKPRGAIHLEVGYQTAQPSPVAPTGRPGDGNEAVKALEAANARFTFVVQPSPPDDGPWEGAWHRPGLLRLVATGPGTFCVVVLKLQ